MLARACPLPCPCTAASWALRSAYSCPALPTLCLRMRAERWCPTEHSTQVCAARCASLHCTTALRLRLCSLQVTAHSTTLQPSPLPTNRLSYPPPHSALPCSKLDADVPGYAGDRCAAAHCVERERPQPAGDGAAGGHAGVWMGWGSRRDGARGVRGSQRRRGCRRCDVCSWCCARPAVQRSTAAGVHECRHKRLPLQTLQVSTRVTRRSEEWQGDDRLSTSEYFQQLIASPSSPQPKVSGLPERGGRHGRLPLAPSCDAAKEQTALLPLAAACGLSNCNCGPLKAVQLADHSIQPALAGQQPTPAIHALQPAIYALQPCRSRPHNASRSTTGGPRPRRQPHRAAACKWWLLRWAAGLRGLIAGALACAQHSTPIAHLCRLLAPGRLMVCHEAIHLVCPISQVVSDYLTAFDDPAMMMQAGGKPVVVYTYRCGAHAGQEWCLGGGGRCGRLQARQQSPASGMPCCRSAVQPAFPPVAKVAPLTTPCILGSMAFRRPAAAVEGDAAAERAAAALEGVPQ